MATLQKFKLLATQCAVAGSPTRSPTASPVIHLRRRKTLRMLLNRHDRRRRQFHRRSPDGEDDVDDVDDDVGEVVKEKTRARHKLKDLFVSSPSPPNDGGDVGLLQGRGGGGVRRFEGGGSLRPITAAFRFRLMRRAWRPMLVTIPE